MQSYFKKVLALAITAITISVLSVSNINAQSAEDYLRQIAFNTTQILQKVDMLPGMILIMLQNTLNWMAADKSDATANLQVSFTNMGNGIFNNITEQNTLQQKLNTLLIGSNLQKLPFANDLVYSSILGLPFIPDPRNPPGTIPQVNPPFNYIVNAAGLTIPHVPPENWTGGDDIDKTKYLAYYNAVMSIQSFNGYVLSKQYLEGNTFNTTQQALLLTLKDPAAWFTKIASEEMSVVVRQLLLIESQTFVLLSQLVQTQKQMVTAQAMTNTLLIASNQLNESVLLSKAKNTTPT